MAALRDSVGLGRRLGLLSSPIWWSSRSKIIPFSSNPLCGRHGPTTMLLKNFEHAVRFHKSRLHSEPIAGRNILRGLSLTGINICKRSFIGISATAGSMCIWASHAHAMDGTEVLVSPGESSGILEEDLHTFWMLAKKFQIPFVLFLMVMLGWRHPVALFINVLLLLTCTRPSPLSIYMFIEQLRMQDMLQDPGLSKLKLFYARKVDVQDYKLLCLASVELRGRKLSLVGILGSWWILRSSTI